MPSDKLVIGLAPYGRSFKLDGSSTNIGSAALTGGASAGKVNMLEICILTVFLLYGF
jgi:hypothetical protein